MPSAQLELNFESFSTLSAQDISDYYADRALLSDSVNQMSHVEKYIHDSTNQLFDGNVDQDLAVRLSVCLGLFYFADSIFSMQLGGKKLEQNLISTVQRKPYLLGSNIGLNFGAKSNPDAPIIPVCEFNFNSTAYGLFSQRDSFVKDMHRRRKSAYDVLSGRRGYCRALHHELVGLHVFCIPVFAGRDRFLSRQIYTDYIRKMDKREGEFLLPFPNVLAKYFKKDDEN